ncbi:L-fucose mutarotase [bacterium]|nr:L-fucose mutarotase [bacterium]
MLIGISPLLSPELLATLSSMGHGDEIILADAHFPGESCNAVVIRADGLKVADMMDAILPLFALDSYDDHPVNMIAVVEGDTCDPAVELSFRAMIDKHQPATAPIKRIDRFEFYKKAQNAFAIVMTGETAKYGTIALKKGVTPV